MSRSALRSLFGMAGVYDFIIGLVFLGFGPRLFAAAGLTQPNHWGYIQFAALLLMIFATMFVAVARDPIANRNLIPYGMLLKAAYVGIVAFYWAAGDCPWLFKPFAVIDGIMLGLFGLALRGTASPPVGNSEGGNR